MVLVQKWPFSKVFFLGNIVQENVFYDMLERKNAYLNVNTRSSNSRKIEIFPQGLNHGLAKKIAIFQPFF